MSLNDQMKSASFAAISLAGLILTFYTVANLMLFLSDPSYSKELTYRQEYSGDHYWVSTSRALLVNTILLSAFIFQHSLLTLSATKELFSSLNLLVLQRSIYVISTCLVLQLLIKYWYITPQAVLWQFNTDIRMYWWSFCSIHTFAWAIIYVGSICMDVNELLGIKQVYYCVRNLPDPNLYKSRELKRLYSHIRHPSFIGFLLIFWATPVMSLDRLLLALVLSGYMYLVWNTDEHDYHYQKQQFSKKYTELNCSH